MRLPSGDTQELPMRPMAQSVSGVIRPSFTIISCLPMMGPSVCAVFSGPTQADVASIMAAVIVIKSVFFMCLFDGLMIKILRCGFFFLSHSRVPFRSICNRRFLRRALSGGSADTGVLPAFSAGLPWLPIRFP